MFKGVYTALITPFTKTEAVDEAALDRLVDEQIAGGVQGLVPVGTTGESPTVSPTEHLRIIELVVGRVAGRAAVVAGSGANSTAEALELTKQAKALGATASLQVVPYYNKPNQEGLYRHFSTLADAVDLPIILYNIPGRTAKLLETGTIIRLASHPNIVGLKQSVETLGQAMEVLAQAPADFAVLSGDDIQTLPLMALGACGVISVLSNLVPDRMVALCQAIQAGNLDRARQLHYRLLPLFQDLFLDTNPIPVKYAAHLLGKIQLAYRLPLTPPAEDLRRKLQATLRAQALL